MREIHNNDGFGNPDFGLNLYIPFSCNPNEIAKQVERIYNKRKNENIDSFEYLYKKYAIHQHRYTVYSIRNNLLIYKEIVNRFDDLNNKKIRLYDIFYDMSPRIMMRRNVRSVAPDEASRKMGENFDQACRLLYNAGEGRFPDFSKPKRQYNPRTPEI